MHFPTTRVLTVLELLQSRQQISGPELATRLEVDVRTVRRYIVMLQDLGIPVEAMRGRYGTYRLRPGFKLPPLMFTDDEALGLTLGLLAARKIGLLAAAPAVEGALAKIERVLPAALRERVRAVQETLTFDFTPADAAPSHDIVGTLCAAALQQRRVTLRYRAYGSAETERDLDPYGLVYRSGFWYVAGYCHLRDDPEHNVHPPRRLRLPGLCAAFDLQHAEYLASRGTAPHNTCRGTTNRPTRDR